MHYLERCCVIKAIVPQQCRVLAKALLLQPGAEGCVHITTSVAIVIVIRGNVFEWVLSWHCVSTPRVSLIAARATDTDTAVKVLYLAEPRTA